MSTKMKVGVTLPMTQVSYYKPAQWPAIHAKVSETFKLYGKIITLVAKLVNVPVPILNAFIFIESAGKASIVSSAGAVGLMQITPDTATNIIHTEHKEGRLSKAEMDLLRKHLGKKLDCILSFKYMNQSLPCNKNTGKVITKEDLLKPELNILIGAILLGNLIDKHTENKVVRLDKVIVRYNAGYNYKPQGNTVEETMAFAKKKGGAETANYISKLVGPNGVLTNLA